LSTILAGAAGFAGPEGTCADEGSREGLFGGRWAENPGEAEGVGEG